MTIRNYSSRAQQTTLSASLAAGDPSATVVSGSNLMGGVTPSSSTYTVVIDPDTTLEEIVDITAVSGNIITITRGIDGSSGVAHSAGAIVRHMVTGRDLREANNHSENVTSAHGLTIANVVSTTNAGTVTSNMIANDTIVDADINTAAAIAWTKLAPSATVSAAEVGRLAGVTSAIQTQIDAKLASATAASTYAPLASPALTGVPTAPTATLGTSTTQVATTAFVGNAVSDLVASAPAALNTLNELALALGNDANFATTTATSIATKLPKSGGTMTGAIDMGTTNKITSLATPTVATDAATKGYADSIVATAPSNLTGPITSVGAATSIASQTGTGTKFVVDTSPTLVTPVLGVATATSVNGTTIPTSKTLVVTTDKLSALAGTTSAELAGVISDETGSGALVFATSPTLVTPNLGTPSAINLTNATAVPSDATKAPLASPTFTGTVTIPAGAVVTTPKISNVALGFSTQATAASTLTLTVSSNGVQEFTGTTASQVVQMPVTSTLSIGWQSTISNKSTQTIAVNSSGGNLIYTVPAGTDWLFTCNAITGTTAASWSNSYTGASAVPSATVSFNTNYNYVATAESTTSTTFTALTTASAVTVTTGTKALVSIKALLNNNGGESAQPAMSFAVSGATTLAANVEHTISLENGTGVGVRGEFSGTFLVTGLTAGSNTFTTQFRNENTSSSVTFSRRSIAVVDLGS